MDKDIVFIDTSVYIAENYFAPNNRINSLRDLAAKGVISIVSTVITDNEVLKHFKDDVSSAWNSLKNSKSLANFNETRALLFKDTKTQWLKKCEASFKKFKDRGNIFTIDYKYCNDVESIFEKYFKAEKPFNVGKKKNEFPDAFVLQTLEHYCKENSLKPIIVLSKDKDLKDYKSDYIIYKDYCDYVTEKLTETDLLEKIRTTIHEKEYQFCNEIKDQLENELYDDRNYYGLFNSEDSPEVEIVECKVEMNDGFSIISKEDNKFIIELKFKSYCEVKCTYFNLDYATYDREDNRWYGGELETDSLSGEENFRMIVSYDNETCTLNMESFKLSDALPNFRCRFEY